MDGSRLLLGLRTPLFARGEIVPEYISIKPGSLDDTSWHSPTIDTWGALRPGFGSSTIEGGKTPNVVRGSQARSS